MKGSKEIEAIKPAINVTFPLNMINYLKLNIFFISVNLFLLLWVTCDIFKARWLIKQKWTEEGKYFNFKENFNFNRKTTKCQRKSEQILRSKYNTEIELTFQQYTIVLKREKKLCNRNSESDISDLLPNMLVGWLLCWPSGFRTF